MHDSPWPPTTQSDGATGGALGEKGTNGGRGEVGGGNAGVKHRGVACEQDLAGMTDLGVVWVTLWRHG